MKILIVSYGSISKKKHVKYALELGLTPVVLTNYPEERNDVIFINDITKAKNIKLAVIASPTNRHYDDLKNIALNTECNKILLEKPIEANIDSANKILKLATEYKLDIKVAYCFRFLPVIKRLKKEINVIRNKIRLVNIVAGQYLPEWRPKRDYSKSYSADKNKGGGVQLDLSHEIDYILWLFGRPQKIEYLKKDKISDLEINSVDFFHAIYKYNKFYLDLKLDYFRKSKRFIEIIGENQNLIYCDFISKKLMIYDKLIQNESLFNFPLNYKIQLQEFIYNNTKYNLATLKDGYRIYEYIGEHINDK